jgi:GMC oxidoreductase
MNEQSHGTVTLQSSDPSAAPIIDPNFLAHPYDRRVLIDGVRQTMQMLSAPIYASRTIEKLGPKDETDEEIWVSLCPHSKPIILLKLTFVISRTIYRGASIALGTCPAQLGWAHRAIQPV